jgi:hypothetical protein
MLVFVYSYLIPIHISMIKVNLKTIRLPYLVFREDNELK